MNKTAKMICVGVGALCLLSGGLVALKLTEPKESTADSSSEAADTTTVLWSTETADISSVKIDAGGNGIDYTVVRKESEADATDDTLNYYLEEYQDLPMNVTLIRTVANNFSEVTSVKTIAENATDLEKYGLEDPVATVTAYYDDGSEKTLCIGNISPVTDQTYCMVEGGTTVYTMSTTSSNPFVRNVTEYISTTVCDELEDDSTTIVESVKVERTNLDYDLCMEYDTFYAELENGGTAASHIMTSPILCNLNVDSSSSITHGIFGLTAAEVLTLHPTSRELADAGLDEPFCTVTMVTDDDITRVLKIGATYSNAADTSVVYYYGYFEGVDVIYGFTADTVPWTTVVPADIASKLIFATYVWDIGQLTIEAAGHETLDFTCQGTSADDFIVTRDGETVETERYRTLYAFLLKTYGEDVCLDTPVPAGEPIATITLARQDGLKSQTVSFYPADGLKAYVVVDGQCYFKCRMAFVDTLLANMDIFDTDQAFTTTW